MATLRDILIAPGNKAFDIDDTFIPLKNYMILAINTYFSPRNDYAVPKLHKPFKEHDYIWLGLEQSRIFVEAGITKEDKLKLFKYMEHTGILEKIMPQVYAVATLNSLSKYGVVPFVTSRANGFYDDPIGLTNRWLENVKKENRCFVPPEVIYTHNKDEVLEENNITVLFDDNPTFALSVLKKDVPVVLFNQPWNRLGFNDRNIITPDAYDMKVSMLDELKKYEGKGLYRVDNWLEVFKALF